MYLFLSVILCSSLVVFVFCLVVVDLLFTQLIAARAVHVIMIVRGQELSLSHSNFLWVLTPGREGEMAKPL